MALSGRGIGQQVPFHRPIKVVVELSVRRDWPTQRLFVPLRVFQLGVFPLADVVEFLLLQSPPTALSVQHTITAVHGSKHQGRFPGGRYSRCEGPSVLTPRNVFEIIYAKSCNLVHFWRS